MYWHLFFATLTLSIFIYGRVDDRTQERVCYRQFYVEYGEDALLQCNFTQGFTNIQWYAGSDRRPTILLNKGVVSGPGYDSGKLNITRNGSLRIRDVNYGDEGYYSVVVGYGDISKLLEETFQVIVFIRPYPSFPKVDECGDKNICLVGVDEIAEFHCNVRAVKPQVFLNWYEKVDHKDKQLEADSFSSKKGNTFSSFSSVDLGASSLKVISCQSYSPFPTMRFNETIVLVENTTAVYPINDGTSLFYNLHSDVILNCSKHNLYYFIWKFRSVLDRDYTTVGYTAYGKSEVFKANAQILKNGSLFLKDFQVPDEGEYICIYNVNDEKIVNGFIVKTFIAPSPPYPQIIGCVKGPSDCSRIVDKQDYMTCFVQGIRPPVHLDFKVVGDGPSPISFSNLVPEEDIKDKVYYISVRENFEIMAEEPVNITVECRASGPNVDTLVSKQARITLSYQPFTDGSEKHFVPTALIVLICGKAFAGLW